MGRQTLSLLPVLVVCCATFAQQPYTEQAERKLLSAMAALKREFGLTDRYQVEAWRPWRE